MSELASQKRIGLKRIWPWGIVDLKLPLNCTSNYLVSEKYLVLKTVND